MTNKNWKDEASQSILAILILFTTLLAFQLVSYISNIDLLAPFPGLNLIIVPISVIIAIAVMHILSKSNQMGKLLIPINKLIDWVEKWPLVFNFFKFLFKHPILSAILIGVIWAILKNLVISLI